jgi:hypothetical protein
MPIVGRRYKIIDKKGNVYYGILERIARMRTGAVIGFVNTSEGVKGFPVSKYAEWREIN